MMFQKYLQYYTEANIPEIMIGGTRKQSINGPANPYKQKNP